MDTHPHHDVADLFAQLGLPFGEADIRAFVRRHGPLPDGLPLSRAPFWNGAQREFLREQWHADSDWAPAVDALNAMLHAHPEPGDGLAADGG